MPKEMRSPEEIRLVKENIMNNALELIVEEGFEKLTMRKLASRLGIAAKTIYNYFQNQEELLFCLMTRMFEKLCVKLDEAVSPYDDVSDKIRAVISAQIDFGLDNRELYNLMSSMHTPTCGDFMDSPIKKAANDKYEAAMKCYQFYLDLIRQLPEKPSAFSDEELQIELLHITAHISGYINGVINKNLSYLFDNPENLKEMVIERILANTRRALTTI